MTEIKEIENFKKTDEDCGDFAIEILRDGTWMHEGRPIKRHRLVKLFATVLKRDENGQHWLETPVEKGRIDVEDSAFVTTDLALDEGVITITTNIDQSFEIGADHPLVMREGVPYVSLYKNLEARVVRPHYYELAAQATEDQGKYMISSNGIAFEIGQVDHA